MVVYNVTIKVDLDVHNDWITWMKTTHIPDVMATGYFSDHRMLRILEDDQTDGIAYAVQYHAKDMQHYFDYIANEAPRLREEMNKMFEGKYVAFRTVMKVV